MKSEVFFSSQSPSRPFVGGGAKLQNLGLRVYSQTPVAAGCVHSTTRQRAWSAVEQNPRHVLKDPNWTQRAATSATQACKETYEHCSAIERVGAEAKAKLMVKGASGQLLREHTRNCFFVCSFRASASATCSCATSPAESCSREIVPQARVECSQPAETHSRRKTSTAREGLGA